jgi:hypothetical protein
MALANYLSSLGADRDPPGPYPLGHTIVRIAPHIKSSALRLDILE